MAYGSIMRWRGYRGNSYGSGYKPTWSLRTRSSRRRANREARAARQQRDSCTVTISRIGTISVQVGSGVTNGSGVISHWNELRQSAFFPNYAPMYDQMKIDKIRVKVTGSRAGSAQTTNISPAVVLAFDRNGLSPAQQLSTATISTYSSAQLKQWSSGNAFTMWQTIYPSTIMEKGQYIPTESLVDPTDDTSSENPCTYLSDPQMPFKPITLIGVDLGVAPGADNTFAFTIEYEYTVTFRGMRKPSLSYSADLRPLSLSLTSNGSYAYIPDGFDGYSSVAIQANIPYYPTTGTTLLNYLYDDYNSTQGISLSDVEWLYRSADAGTTSFSSPVDTILLVDFMINANTHVIVLRSNKSSSTTSWSIPEFLRTQPAYYVRLSGSPYTSLDVAPWLGTINGPFVGSYYIDNTTNSQTTSTVTLRNVTLYPGWAS